MTTHAKIYPGLNDSSVEFFNLDNQVKVFNDRKMVEFQDLPYAYHKILKDGLKKEPETNNILKEWFPDSEMKRLEKLAKCRFGGLDFNPDIKDMQLQAGEYWDCPLRGFCKGEGKVCHALTYNGNTIQPKDIQALRLLATSKTNEVIAEELQLPMGTFNVFKKELYQKLGIQTKQEAVVIAVSLNLI